MTETAPADGDEGFVARQKERWHNVNVQNTLTVILLVIGILVGIAWLIDHVSIN